MSSWLDLATPTVELYGSPSPVFPRGAQAVVADTIDVLVQKVVAAARPGDQVLCMSNGGFGGIHGKLLDALAARAR